MPQADGALPTLIWTLRWIAPVTGLLFAFLVFLFAVGEGFDRACEPRRVPAELGKITVVDVVLPTRSGVEIRKRCVTRPKDHQAILLQRLGLHLPSHLENTTME